VIDASIADVRCHPTKAAEAAAGGLENGTAYYSANGGKTWKAATHAKPWTGRVELTYAVKNPAIVYASVQMQDGEIWASSDGGRTYGRRDTQIASGHPAPYLGDQGWYGNVIWAGDPTDERFVIVGGVDLWKSTDGGNTLAPISTWYDPKSAHTDHHVIVARPDYDGHTKRTVFSATTAGYSWPTMSTCSEARPSRRT
jgi:hypothetical protein